MNFQASIVEANEDEELGVITVHFDSGDDHYMQFQGASIGFEDEYYDNGYVYAEIDDQIWSGYDCFTNVRLTRGKIELLGISDERMCKRAEQVEVMFAIDCAKFDRLTSLLQKMFRDCPRKLEIEAEPSGG